MRPPHHTDNTAHWRQFSPPLQPRRSNGGITSEAVVQPSITDGDVAAALRYAADELRESKEPFTFKSVVYQTKLKQLVPKPDSDKRKYISTLCKLPEIPVNSREERIVATLRALPANTQVDDFINPGDRFTVKERLEDVLTSLGNKVLFLLMIELGTWYVRAPARKQITHYLLEFIWPSCEELRARFEETVHAFMETRIRYFRDSVARYFRPRLSLNKAEDFKDPLQPRVSEGASTMADSPTDLLACPPTEDWPPEPVFDHPFF